VCTHPVAGSQVSAVHSLLSSQFFGVPPRQTPFEQASPTRHLLVEQDVPFWVVSATHNPVLGSHLRHWAHGFGSPDWHVPLLHVSPSVQRFPSSHGAPFAPGFAIVVHPPFTHARTRQGASAPVGSAHETPQSPQLLTSSARLTHLPASGLLVSGQTTSPVGHVHFPDEQPSTAPVGQHLLPQTSGLPGEQQNFSVAFVKSVRQLRP
jgi:hypothetical protein